MRFFKLFFPTFILFLLLFVPLSYAVEENPNTDPLTKSVMVEFDKHNYKKLIKTYEDYKEKNPQKYIPLKTRAIYCQALADVGDLEGAIRNLKELTQDWPIRLDVIKLQYDLANLLFMQGLKDEAKDEYEKILLKQKSILRLFKNQKSVFLN
ncbi:MAG: tetratricopeptide repeat protein [Deltaproteobacteria bacterium]|nr:MAG: tetratricopeptide repeat protein [Deltaproteobacteria bacterium]